MITTDYSVTVNLEGWPFVTLDNNNPLPPIRLRPRKNMETETWSFVTPVRAHRHAAMVVTRHLANLTLKEKRSSSTTSKYMYFLPHALFPFFAGVVSHDYCTAPIRAQAIIVQVVYSVDVPKIVAAVVPAVAKEPALRAKSLSLSALKLVIGLQAEKPSTDQCTTLEQEIGGYLSKPVLRLGGNAVLWWKKNEQRFPRFPIMRTPCW